MSVAFPRPALISWRSISSITRCGRNQSVHMFSSLIWSFPSTTTPYSQYLPNATDRWTHKFDRAVAFCDWLLPVKPDFRSQNWLNWTVVYLLVFAFCGEGGVGIWRILTVGSAPGGALKADGRVILVL